MFDGVVKVTEVEVFFLEATDFLVIFFEKVSQVFFVLGEFVSLELSGLFHVPELATVQLFLLFDTGLEHKPPLL